MHVAMGILGSQGVVRLVELFGEIPAVAECMIAGLSAGLITFFMLQWERR